MCKSLDLSASELSSSTVPAVQAIPELAANVGSGELLVFQRTASSVDARNDFETDAEWAASRPKGYFNGRREKMLAVAGKRAGFMPAVEGAEQMSPEEKVLRSLRFPWLLSTTCLVQYRTAQYSTVRVASFSSC